MFTYISTVLLFIFEKRLGGNVSDYQQQLSLNIVAGRKEKRAAGIHTFSLFVSGTTWILSTPAHIPCSLCLSFYNVLVMTAKPTPGPRLQVCLTFTEGKTQWIQCRLCGSLDLKWAVRLPVLVKTDKNVSWSISIGLNHMKLPLFHHLWPIKRWFL